MNPLENQPLPMCDRCKKPVDYVDMSHDLYTRVATFTAYCHGDKEVVKLTDNVVADADKITTGVAFLQSSPQLPDPSEE